MLASEEVLVAVERIATREGMALDDIRESVCDLEGRTPEASETIECLRFLLLTGLIRQAPHGRYFLVALDGES